MPQEPTFTILPPVTFTIEPPEVEFELVPPPEPFGPPEDVERRLTLGEPAPLSIEQPQVTAPAATTQAVQAPLPQIIPQPEIDRLRIDAGLDEPPRLAPSLPEQVFERFKTEIAKTRTINGRQVTGIFDAGSLQRITEPLIPRISERFEFGVGDDLNAAIKNIDRGLLGFATTVLRLT